MTFVSWAIDHLDQRPTRLLDQAEIVGRHPRGEQRLASVRSRGDKPARRRCVRLYQDLNFAASFSVSRASTPVSAPTATNRPPHSSQRRASASTPVRIPGALPAFLMRRIASSMIGTIFGLFVSPG